MSLRLQRSGRDQESVYGKDIVIRDNRGRTVRHLRNGSARCVVWNLKDEIGGAWRCHGGVYDISRFRCGIPHTGCDERLFAEHREVAVEHIVGGCERALLIVEHAEFFLLQKGAYFRLTVEIMTQFLVDGLEHPVFCLFVAFCVRK